VQIDDEQGVGRHQPTPRQHFGGEESAVSRVSQCAWKNRDHRLLVLTDLASDGEQEELQVRRHGNQ
jgi:hypothetical protein